MKSLFLFLLVFLSVAAVNAQQDSSFVLLKTHKGNFVNFTVDNLDNIYLVTADGRIEKKNANGDSAAVFNDVRRYGKLFSIDAGNPLKVLLFYKDFGTIVVLDRFLNVRNTIDLRKKNILQVQAICLSYDNKIWLYDELENKIKKIDEDGTLLSETTDFRQLLNDAPSPQKISDQDGYVYAYDSLKGAFVFDYYGAFKNKIAFTGWQNYKVAGNYIYGVQQDTLFRYQLNTFNLLKKTIPAQIKTARKFNFTASRLYAMKKEGLEIYSLR
jgi:hypothetical protein